MALRVWDDLSGDFGLAAPFRSPDQLIYDESSWTDLSGRWASFMNHSSVLGHAGLRLPSLLKNASPFALRAPDGYDGGAGGQAAPPSPTGSGPLATGPGDNIGDNMSSTTTIAIGGTINSSINTGGDLDYIRVTLTAGQTYVFSMEGISLVDPLLDLRDSSGTLVATDDDGGIGRDAFLMYHAQTSGDYWIVAQGWSVLSGTYSLTVNAIDTGNSSPTTFPDNGKRPFSWDEAGVQINRDGAGWTDAFGTPPSQVITYAFRASEPFTMPEGTGEFSRFSAAQIAAAEHALAAWAAVANVTFVRVSDAATPGYSDSATILFGNYATGAAGAAAFAYLPINANRSVSSLEGDVWVNNNLSYNANPVLGDYGYQVLLHEIGHALGLTHPGEYNAGEGEGPIEYPTHAEYFNDSRVFTVMSYFGSTFVGGNLGLFASLPQLHDIAAIQRLYGANFATRTGDTIYGYNSNTGVPEYTLTLTNQNAVFAIWDGGGLDTLDFSGYTTANTIDLREEAFSSVGGFTYNVSIARGVVIENAIGGSGADTIIGNAANNVLKGGAGADSLEGGAGDDILDGGAGVDRLFGGDGNDVIFWDAADDLNNVQGGAGVDLLVFTSGSAPTFFNLTSHGFEGAEGRFIDTGSADWSSQTLVYDGLWRLDTETTNFDDGSHAFHDYDQTDQFIWSDEWTLYDAQGRVDVIVTTFDDGTYSNNNHDQDDSFVWSSEWTRYDAQDRVDVIVTTFDDGTYSINEFDAAGAQPWSTQWTHYDALDRVDTVFTTFDDGSYSINEFDVGNAQPWSTQWTRYDVQNRVDTVVTTYDDGSYAILDNDEADAFAWASMWWLYDTQGHLVQFIGTNDDGSFF